MNNKTDNALGSVEPRANEQKRKYSKRDSIFEIRFSFTDATLSRVKKRLGKTVDRRFDEKIPGLCLKVSDNDRITFYAYKRVPQYNSNKNSWEPNTIYKKMFVWSKNTGFNCNAAKDKVAAYLDRIVDSRSLAQDEITFGDLAKKYMEKRLTGFKLQGNETREYKPGVIKQYTSIIKSYILLVKGTKELKKKLTKPIEYQGKIWNKPLKDFKKNI